jgi:Zn-dependent protease with chaperone function
MQYRVYRSQVPRNPIAQFVALVVAAIVAVGAVFLGAILLSLFLGLAVIAGLVFYFRLWWLRRRMAQSSSKPGGGDGQFVEVEYTVVDERSMSDDDPGKPRG